MRLLVLVVAGLSATACASLASEGDRGSVRASGGAKVETGAPYSGTFANGTGNIDITAADTGGRVTPLPPHDALSVNARVEADGHVYEVRVREPAVGDPLGRFTTWWGVGVNVEHHGRSGIGSDKVPAVRSKLAAFGIGDVTVDGRPAAQGVLVHVMTMDNDMVELDVGDGVADPIDGLPQRHLRVQWSGAAIDVPQAAHGARYLLGAVVLLVSAGVMLALNRRIAA